MPQLFPSIPLIMNIGAYNKLETLLPHAVTDCIMDAKIVFFSSDEWII